MDQSAVDSPVTLVIKAPNQKYDDQTINCFLNWTVEKLKSHLSNVYPSKPLSKDQRLVYSGRLLPDHLQLRDVLRKQDEYHMVHLVCASRTPPGSPEPSGSNRTQTQFSTPAPPSSAGSSSSGTSSPAAPPSLETPLASSSVNSESLRYRGSPRQPTSPEHNHAPHSFTQGHVGNQFPGPQGLPAGFPLYPVYHPAQVLWWQQMYARHYYMQYRAAAASSQPSGPLPPPERGVPQSAEPPPPPPHEPPALPEDRPANPNVQMNAQGGAVINEEDLNRDWLDWVYTFSRAAILLSIVYFYSSFSRFVMVVGAMLLVYLHQAGWFPFRGELANQGGGGNPNEQEAEHRQDIQEMERIMDEGLDEDGGDGGDTPAEDPNAVPHPGFLASAWSFITTFFTSLIPEGPPHAAN
uniref:Homocysteine-responsive endoplasmic reticulum-resident ubiquitin-like domain member 2 protein n=1 Tax=Lepisosteus oculatus TaxID=7918 RepID=W5M3E4_LEPOC|nr:PREDICTED: homocysteine-responsive endoplasmic reticulum-resident ubiquitin-like domain member 2 protein isoform X1 [Lepisosteus oculatus]XP_015212428.1 PREDICTED: homocysteine-responsive endoplasmic reticulum-resident ubiquitin-like domain member 2 protein isoform X1 [Lepisosteus oculatus]